MLLAFATPITQSDGEQLFCFDSFSYLLNLNKVSSICMPKETKLMTLNVMLFHHKTEYFHLAFCLF